MLGDPPVPLFNKRDRDMLDRLADYLLPIHSPDSGERVYDFVAFLEAFLSAFEVEPPRIYAGGPFSDRNPVPGAPAPPNDFKQSLPLSRYQRLAWTLRLHGPQAVVETDPFVVLSDHLKNNYVGLREIVFDGLQKAVRLADDFSPRPVSPDALLLQAGPDFRVVFRGLVVEAAFSAPEYGGNLGTWPVIYYPGDSQPNGYSDSDVSNPGPGPDPFPIHTLGELILTLSTVFEHGKVFK